MFDYILSVYTDGGSRGNPGPSAFGFVVKKGQEGMHKAGKAIGIATNNIAEYSAILEALTWIAGHRELIGEISGINMYMDSQLACRQLHGIYKIKNVNLAGFLIKIREMEKKINIPVNYFHIPREKNREADRLVNQALDK